MEETNKANELTSTFLPWISKTFEKIVYAQEETFMDR